MSKLEELTYWGVNKVGEPRKYRVIDALEPKAVQSIEALILEGRIDELRHIKKGDNAPYWASDNKKIPAYELSIDERIAALNKLLVEEEK